MKISKTFFKICIKKTIVFIRLSTYNQSYFHDCFLTILFYLYIIHIRVFSLINSLELAFNGTLFPYFSFT